MSSVKSNVYVANIDGTKSFSSSKPSIALTGLKYRTVPYWFRVKVGNGSSHAWSAIYSVSLQPSAPTGVSVTTSGAGTWLQWTAGRGTGFQVVRATDPALSQGKVVFTSRSTVHQFSPYPLAAGTTSPPPEQRLDELRVEPGGVCGRGQLPRRPARDVLQHPEHPAGRHEGRGRGHRQLGRARQASSP